MIDIKNEKVLANQLALGMFVTKLDKPWIESDFMLQGFILEDQADLDKMAASCAYVYIDRTRSLGDQYADEPVTKNTSPQRSSIRVTIATEPDKKRNPVLNKVSHGEKISFMDILREVRNYKAPTDNIHDNQADSRMDNADISVESQSLSHTRSSIRNTQREKKQLSKPAHNTDSVFGYLNRFVSTLFNREKFTDSDTTAVDGPTPNELSYEELLIYESTPSVEEEIANIYPIFEQSEIVTRDLFDGIANDHHIDISNVSEVLDNMVDSISRSPDALLWLTKLKKADGHSYNLALNVSVTLMAFASFLSFPKDQVKTVGFAGLLQDIGKAKLSPEVLLKKGKLDSQEFEHAKTHVKESLAILKKTAKIPANVLKLVLEHHERIDGSGYPLKLKAEQLSLLSQSTGLIDTYCAMTNNRSYAHGGHHQQVLDQIYAMSGKQFSEELIDQLIQFMGIYPVSSLVELNTGEVAVVIQQNQVRRLMPRVMLLLNQEKQRYSSPIVLDLIYQPIAPNGEIYRINKGIPADSYGLNPNEFYI